MYEYYGTDEMAVTENFPPEEKASSSDEEGGTGYWVEALGLDVRNDDNTGAVEISLKVYSGLPKPSKDITVRYYLDTSEVKDPSIIESKILYDQASVEIKGASSEITKLTKWDKMDNVYYVELKWNDCTFANSGKKTQFSVGFYGKGYTDPATNKYVVYDWDPTNDWSFETLKLGVKSDFFAVEDPPEVPNDHICIYDDGVLVGGTEPDGTKPEEAPTEPKNPAPTEATTKTTTEPTTKAPSDETVLYGDVNEDKTVDILDVIALNKYLLGISKLQVQQQKNADVDVSGTVDANDSLNILKYALEIIKALPIKK
jgi:hypothetical protein